MFGSLAVLNRTRPETLMKAVQLVRDENITQLPAGRWRRFRTGRHQIYRRSGSGICGRRRSVAHSGNRRY